MLPLFSIMTLWFFPTAGVLDENQRPAPPDGGSLYLHERRAVQSNPPERIQRLDAQNPLRAAEGPWWIRVPGGYHAPYQQHRVPPGGW